MDKDIYALWEKTVEFVLKREIACEEDIYQSYDIIEDEREFFEDVYKFLGYCWKAVQTDKRVKELVNRDDED